MVKKMYKKLTGREKIHFVQSFSPTDKLTYEQAHEIGMRTAEYFKGFQIVVAKFLQKHYYFLLQKMLHLKKKRLNIIYLISL